MFYIPPLAPSLVGEGRGRGCGFLEYKVNTEAISACGGVGIRVHARAGRVGAGGIDIGFEPRVARKGIDVIDRKVEIDLLQPLGGVVPVVREGDILDFEERAVLYIAVGYKPCAVISGSRFGPSGSSSRLRCPAAFVSRLGDITDIGHGDVREVIVEDVITM